MPEVYVNEISSPRSFDSVPSAIPVFIGYTNKRKDENGNAFPVEIIKLIKITSLIQYEQCFGKAENETNLSVNVAGTTNAAGTTNFNSATAFFIGAGTSPHNMYYALKLYFDNGGGSCLVVSVGLSGQPILLRDFEKAINFIEAFTEPMILVFPEGQALSESDYYKLAGLAIDQSARLKNRFTLLDVHTKKTTTIETITNFRNVFTKTDHLSYSAAYYPHLKTNYEYDFLDADVRVNYIMEGIPGDTTTLDKLSPSETNVYVLVKNAIKQLLPVLPPSPALAGIYVVNDRNRGIWKAPANIPVASISDITEEINDATQDFMNVDGATGKSVNAIRKFTGRGLLVWGARTLDGNSNEWRYISVRRFAIMVNDTVKKGAAQFTFHRNDSTTWIQLKALIENYLYSLWRQGALAGTKPENAFYVRIGLGETMTAQDLLNGTMIIEVGLAVVRPAEFIILRVCHKMPDP